MKREVITYNTLEALHMWLDAPVAVAHLRNQHRHVFVIRCWWQVSHNDREIEIQMQQEEIQNFLKTFGFDLGSMSCEDIAESILNHFGEVCIKCEVLEDGYGGATLSR